MTDKNSICFSLRSALQTYPSLCWLIRFLVIIGSVGIFFALLVFVVTGVSEGYFSLELCFSSRCVEGVIAKYKSSILIMNSTLDLLIGAATIGGIVVALMSYLNNAGTSALSNHIANFSIFQNYISNEILRRDRISSASIDILHWYNAIFYNSRRGVMTIAPGYIGLVAQLNDEIKLSNSQAATGVDGGFRYKPHQERLIKILKRFGIQLLYLPRNDFYEVEAQIFSLISCVNDSFCFSDNVPLLLKREYI